MGRKAFYVLALSHLCSSELCSNKSKLEKLEPTISFSVLAAKYGAWCDTKEAKTDLGAFSDKMYLINSVIGNVPFPLEGM